MSAVDNLHDLHEQICYAKCCFCNTMLLVGVPHSSLAMVVTISCGHCSSIFSLNMIKPCTHLFTSLDQPNLEVCSQQALADKKATCCLSLCDSSSSSSSEEEEEEGNDQDSIRFNHVIHKPPEKKQRAPTAYNHFIKEEIKRLKIEHPNMPHKQAFSAAAKNWAHCPQSGYRDGEVHGCDEGDKNMIMHDDEVYNPGNAFHETKALRQSIFTTTPFN